MILFQRRLQKELSALLKDPPSGVSVDANAIYQHLNLYVELRNRSWIISPLRDTVGKNITFIYLLFDLDGMFTWKEQMELYIKAKTLSYNSD